VDGPLYRSILSSEGAKLLDWTLKYRGEKPMVVLGEFGPAGLQVGTGSAAPEPVPMNIGADVLRLGAGTPVGDLLFTGEVGGVLVKETLRFQADRYSFDANVRVENMTGRPLTVTIAMPWVVRRHDKGAEEKFIGQRPTEVVWSSGGHVSRLDVLGTIGAKDVEGEWIGLDSTWYLTALLPKTPGFRLLASGESGGDSKNGIVTVSVRATPTIAPGQTWTGQVEFYVGPKEYERLAAYGLEGTLNFGGFPIPRKYGGLPMEWLGVPILKLMKWVYHYVGNYGVAIILLTVVSKVLFYPLTVKSMRSMRAMQALQPQVNALRSKYKSDPRKLQEETLALYRKHHVNPMGGCLPMVAQIPIFYALYLALSVAVELQNATFLCFGRIFGMDVWICDLASHDPTYVLPILMGITMFLQQKMTPTMGDPRQAKMMLVMPFVFTFMFLNLPAGLVLYWTVSNVLQILQQWFMDRPRSRGAAHEAKDAARA
jgi:YidC/Oxa1 family membrane protein insertase